MTMTTTLCGQRKRERQSGRKVSERVCSKTLFFPGSPNVSTIASVQIEMIGAAAAAVALGNSRNRL